VNPSNDGGKEMTFSPESGNVANAFAKYIKTNDISLIDEFSVDEIKRAIIEFNRSRNSDFYKAMEFRVNDLEAEERFSRIGKERWKDRGVGILIGVIVTVIGGVILWVILP
jgi:hypothetical protein